MTDHGDRPPHGSDPNHGPGRGFHHAGAGFDPQIDGLLNDMLGSGDAAGFIRRILNGQDRQFWTGALVGAGAVALLTNPAIRQAVANLFGGSGNGPQPQGHGQPSAAGGSEPAAAAPETNGAGDSARPSGALREEEG